MPGNVRAGTRSTLALFQESVHFAGTYLAVGACAYEVGREGLVSAGLPGVARSLCGSGTSFRELGPAAGETALQLLRPNLGSHSCVITAHATCLNGYRLAN